MYYRLLLLTIVLAPTAAFGQRSASHDDGRLQQTGNKTESQPNVAVAGNPSLLVSKTAQVSGQDVCGVIRITNTGFGPAAIVGIADSLEVHFFNNVPPSGLTAGSTPNWFKVADVPIALPGPIAPRATATINYCFSLCDARDYPGANSMRNVVTVSVANPPGLPRTFGARSNSFTPPFPDCQACCLPDGSCTDTVPARCTSAGGLPRGTNTDCATSPCLEACCHSDLTCSDKPRSLCQGNAQGLGTNCASTECCLPPSSDISAPHCTGDADCCAGTCYDFVGSQRCCVDNGDSGCAADSDCCFSEYGATCKTGTCCLPPSIEPFSANCASDTDCCAGTCFNFGGSRKCCVENGASGCAADSECCLSEYGATCNGGTCCLPPSIEPFSANCTFDTDCCAGTCFNFGGSNKCCVENGANGCTADSQCCFSEYGATCNAGACCFPPSRDPFAGHCADNADCCGSSVCGSDNFCCLPNFRSGCTSDSNCCSGLICDSGLCSSVAAP